jgi:hypothetical protein
MKTFTLAGIRHQIITSNHPRIRIMPCGRHVYEHSPIYTDAAMPATFIERITISHRNGRITEAERDAAIEAVRLQQL